MNAKSYAMPETPRSPAKQILTFIRSGFVLNVVGCLALALGKSFLGTVISGYALLLFAGLEAWLDPPFRKYRWVFSLVLVGAFIWFSVAVTFATAPLNASAYSPPGNYPAGTQMGGILWDSHLTDMRVVITNPSDADYQDLDVLLRPYAWVYKASVLGDAHTCELSRIEAGQIIRWTRANRSGKDSVTVNREGSRMDTFDTLGDVYTTAASHSGYRLRCDKLPSHYTVEIIFALASLSGVFQRGQLHLRPNQLGMAIFELRGVKSATDMFGPKPPPGSVLLEGSYEKGLKTYSVDRALRVAEKGG